MIVHVNRSVPDRHITALFPTECGGGIAFSLDEIESQSGFYAAFYLHIVEAFADALCTHLQLEKREAIPFARSAIVPLSNFFFDRLLRLERFRRKGVFSVAKAAAMTLPASAEAFAIDTMFSTNFNQWMIAHLAQLLDAPLSEIEIGEETKSRLNPPGLVNYNNMPGWTLVHRKMLAVRRVLSSHIGTHPALELALIKPALIEAGCFGLGKLADLDPDWKLLEVPINQGLRERVFGKALVDARPSFSLLLRQLDIQISCDAVLGSFAAYCRAVYPSQLLEAVPVNLPRVIRRLRRHRGRAYLMGNVNFSTRGSYLRAAARAIGARLIGCQHGGGNYAYIRDYSTGIEGELAQCDEFITWGWGRIATHPALDGLKLTPLPSPFLAARRAKWIDELGPADQRLLQPKKYDVLLMPNKIYPFPPAPTGAALSTADHIQSFAALLRDFVANCARAGVTVFHKPYNKMTAELLKGTLETLPSLGGPYYTCESKLDKGLHSGLLANCGVIVWDQPGSGFLESLTADIPTMLLWPRHFNRETTWTESAFSELEKAGVIFRNSGSLIAELKVFKRSPVEWMHNPQRQSAIARFCREFAWVDDGWRDHWQSYVGALPRH